MSMALIAGFGTRGECDTPEAAVSELFFVTEICLTKLMRELALQRMAVRRHITGVPLHRDGE